MQKQSTRIGFTLVEMLVVIAIIAVLSAILFPVFNSAREKGRETTCMSNLKQIGTAIELYVQDANGFLPLANNRPSEQSDPGIADVLMPYTKSSEIFRCPSDKDDMWQQEGTSYDYAQGMLNIGMPLQRRDLPFGVKPVQCPLVGDFEDDWHPKGPHVLFVDGHVK
ncbi:MAG: type II secretion system protein [Armatimonadota bacterium]